MRRQGVGGFWGERDVYDTAYALSSLADMGKSDDRGCDWLVGNFSPEWEHPGTVALIITALAKQKRPEKYHRFIARWVQWLRDCEETGGGWKYLATTSIVIDALDEVSRTDLTSGAVKWLLTKQNPDGSWGRGEKMVNTTAMALASLKGKREHA